MLLNIQFELVFHIFSPKLRDRVGHEKRPGSQAEKAGVRVGDEVLQVAESDLDPTLMADGRKLTLGMSKKKVLLGCPVGS